MRTRICVLLLVLGACGTPSHSPVEAEIVDEVADAESPSSEMGARERHVHRRMIGAWRTKIFERGAWVDLIWIVGSQRAWHLVTAYADEAMTIPLLRWSIVRHYELGQPLPGVARTYELTWNDLTASLTAYVDDAALFSALGIDDCNLSPFEPLDLAPTNCGAPLFPFRDCTMMDFVELSGDRLTFGDPEQGDRCVARPTRHERWGFDRVRLVDVLDALAP
jgi:hypothetical protein